MRQRVEEPNFPFEHPIAFCWATILVAFLFFIALYLKYYDDEKFLDSEADIGLLQHPGWRAL